MDIHREELGTGWVSDPMATAQAFILLEYLKMFALMEVAHGDFGPLFEDRDDALDSLRLIQEQLPNEADDYAVIELDRDGFPIGEPISNPEAARPQLA